jgi:hypothetical protein
VAEPPIFYSRPKGAPGKTELLTGSSAVDRKAVFQWKGMANSSERDCLASAKIKVRGLTLVAPELPENRAFMRASLSLQLSLLFVALVSGNLWATETRISKADLPVLVQKTADAQAIGGTVRGYSKDTEDGKLEYEVEMTVKGHSKDITIAPDGTLLEIEEQVSIDSLAPEVRSGLTAKAAKGKISKVESLTKHGKIVAYEAKVLTAGKRSEIQVGPDGKSLHHDE